MNYPKDIQSRIESDFGDGAQEALVIIDEAIKKTDYLNHARIIRCIIFLAKGNVESLKHYIDVTVYDPRDVMLWAEYKHPGKIDRSKRIRDFNKAFGESEVNVAE